MKKRQTKSAAAMIENLEERRLMSVSYNASTDELTVAGHAGNDIMSISESGGSVSVQHTDSRGGHADTFFAWDKPVRTIKVYTYEGNDSITLSGGVPRTYCYAGAGDDTMNGSSVTTNSNVFQSFSWFGNDGNDTVTGTRLYDAIHGHAGNDNLSGGAHQDAIFGWDGDDVIRGGDGDDWLYGDNGNDDIYGDNGADHLYGLNGSDECYGGEHNDVISGGYGADALYGENGDDTFEAREYNSEWDWIFGGAGNDICWERDASDWFFQ